MPIGSVRVADDGEHGPLLEDAEPFDTLLQRSQALADKMNAAARRST